MNTVQVRGHMARQAGDPRVRYIGFRIERQPPLERKRLIQAIRDTGRNVDPAGHEAAAPWLTRYDGTYGVVRCAHQGVDTVRRILGALQYEGEPVPVETIATSGTIRSLVEKHLPGLTDRGEERR